MLSAHDLALSFGDRLILNGVSLTLLPGERVALVGQNGAGKSSLLRVLARMEEPDTGFIEQSSTLTIGFLAQTPNLDPNKSVVETVRDAMKDHLLAIARHQNLCEELAISTHSKKRHKIEQEIAELANLIEHKGGFDVLFQVERVLSKLSIKAREQAVGTLSGGETRRVDLARILLSAPDIYLLDEPTNHLDMQAIAFLVETFAKSKSALLFVSHDTAFVDELATRIIELSGGKLYTHEPPFVNYLENKLVRELIDERTLHRRERLVVNELSWLRAGTPARTTKQNARIDRAYALIDQVEKDTREQRERKLAIEKTELKRLGSTILEFDDV
ncbi:MAG TPA: ATP-binding cassette domain-containing protein, partial [Myxococcota bacterium]|nr:ATP-binding cassette domain-containing protein [Myxococcota bacterium]